MSKLHVNISEIRNVSTSLRMMNNQVIYAKEEIDRVRRNTDPKIKARNSIGSGLNGLYESLEYIQRNVLNLVNFIDEAMDRYERCEGNIEKEGQAIINSYQGLMVTLGQLSSVIPMTAGMSKNEEMFYNIGDSEVNSEGIEIEDVEDDDESEKTKEKELEKIQKETEKESHESLFSEVIAYMKYGKKGQEILDKEAENEVIEDDKITEQISKFDIKGLRGDLDEASESITGMDFDNTLNAVTVGGEGAAVSDVKSVSKDIEIGSKEGEKLLNNFIDKIVDDSDSIKWVRKGENVKAPQLPEGSQWQRNVLNSFKGGKAVEKTYGEGTTLYRVGGQNGGFWSLDSPPLTEYQWRTDFAIKQEFCNDASILYKMKIQEGSSVSGLDGVVGAQGNGLYGGAHQIYIDFKAVPESWIQTSPTNFIK